jgi:hypothetical protein
MESIDEVITVTRCTFDGPQDKELTMRYPGESELKVIKSNFEIAGQGLRDAYEKVAIPIRERFDELNSDT